MLLMSHEQSPAVNYADLYTPPQLEILGDLVGRTRQSEGLYIATNVQSLGGTTPTGTPRPYKAPFPHDISSYVAGALERGREAELSLGYKPMWLQEAQDPNGDERRLLGTLRMQWLRYEGDYQIERLRATHETGLAGSWHTMGPYLPRSIEFVAHTARLDADAQYRKSCRQLAATTLREMREVVAHTEPGPDRSRELIAAYEAAKDKADSVPYAMGMTDFWQLPHILQQNVVDVVGRHVLNVYEYVTRYGTPALIRELNQPRLVRASGELIAGADQLEHGGRQLAVQAFLAEGDIGRTRGEPFPVSLESLLGTYAVNKELRRATKEIAIATRSLEPGDTLVCLDEGQTIRRSELEAYIEAVCDGVVDTVYEPFKDHSPQRRHSWNSAACDVTERLLEGSNAKISDLRVTRLPNEDAKLDLTKAEARYLEFSVQLRSSGREAILTALRVAVFCRISASNRLEIRRKVEGRASGAKAIQQQVEESQRHARPRTFVVSEALRAVAHNNG